MRGEPMRGVFPDPALYALPGIEQLRAYLSGLVPWPPLNRLTGAQLTQVGAGTASGSMPASPWLMQLESMEVTMLAVGILQAAVRTGLAPATQLEVVGFSIHHLRPANPESGGIIARSRVLHTGRRVIVAEVLVEDGSGRGVAHGTGSVTTSPMAQPPPEHPLRPVEEPRYATPDPYLRPAPGPISAEMLEAMRGDDFGRVLLDGSVVIPVFELLGARAMDVGSGTSSLAAETSDWLCLDRGRVATGVLMALVSGSLHLATSTVTSSGVRIAPVHQAVEFVRTVPADGRTLLARGRITDWDGHRAVASSELVDADGNVVARGQQTAMTAPLRSTPAGVAERVLATVVFTDIAESTRLAESVGDEQWGRMLDEHHGVVRRQLETFKGREIKTTGDGFLALFDSPGRAVQCARAIRDRLTSLGLGVRIGIHTGECEVTGGDVAGIAVHVAARIQTLADAGQILVSNTVRDLVAGSGMHFTDHGTHELKGLEREYQLFAVQG